MRLTLYCDESGTMPKHDYDGPFVCAAVGVLGNLNWPKAVPGGLKWLANQLDLPNVFPSVAYVVPRDGYARRLAERHSTSQRMALYTREITGANSAYLTEKGVPLGNYVWGHVMIQESSPFSVEIRRPMVDPSGGPLPGFASIELQFLHQGLP